MNLSMVVFFLCFFKMTEGLTPLPVDFFVVHQVGQGLWTTHVTNDMCTHYDFGGELIHRKSLQKKFIQQCSKKLNLLNLSHADWDHYAFLDMIVKNSLNVCWNTVPRDHLRTKVQLPYCQKNYEGKILFYESRGRNKNDRSMVQQVKNVLIPGDSSIKMERRWLQYLHTPIKFLILGHHGSRTSTSKELLKALPHLRLAIVSARYQKYQHPHSEVIQKLREHKAPLIRTEDWGNIRIY